MDYGTDNDNDFVELKAMRLFMCIRIYLPVSCDKNRTKCHTNDLNIVDVLLRTSLLV